MASAGAAVARARCRKLLYSGADRVWLYAVILTVGYMVSRGLAKSGSPDPYTEERWADRMRFALWGLVLAAVLFIISGGHILLLLSSWFFHSAG